MWVSVHTLTDEVTHLTLTTHIALASINIRYEGCFSISQDCFSISQDCFSLTCTPTDEDRKKINQASDPSRTNIQAIHTYIGTKTYDSGEEDGCREAS